MTEEERETLVSDIIDQLRDHPSDDDPDFISRWDAVNKIVEAWTTEVDKVAFP